MQLYEIPVIASDQGGRSGFCVVRVRVSDENDNEPIFLLKEYKANIYPNYSINATFVKVRNIQLDS